MLLWQAYSSDVPRRLLCFYITAVVVDGLLAVFSLFLLVPIAGFLASGSTSDMDGLTSLREIDGLREAIDSYGIYFLLSLFVGANFLKGFSDLLTTHLILKIKYQRSRALSLEIASSYLKAQHQFLSQLDRGRFLNTLTRENARYADALAMALEAFSVCFQLAIYVIAPLLLTPLITLGTVIIMVVVSAPFLFLSRFARRYGDLARISANRCSKSIFEIVSYANLFKTFNVTDAELLAYDNHIKSHISSVKIYTLMSRAIPAFLQPISVLAAMVAISISVWQSGNFYLAAPILWSVLRAYPLASRLLGINFAIHTLLPSRQQVEGLRDYLSKNKEQNGHEKCGKITSISFCNVTFSYVGDKVIIKKFNHVFRVGEITLIKGESGVGKSTIVRLMQGHLHASYGDVKVNQQNIKHFELGDLSCRFGYLEQDIALLNRSIRDNISLGARYPDHLITKACDEAGASQIIDALPDGLDTVVDENGANFSGGERQRIGLARILLRNPDVLILDEPTSALDAGNRDIILNEIMALRNDKIIVLISHDEIFEAYADLCVSLVHA